MCDTKSAARQIALHIATQLDFDLHGMLHDTDPPFPMIGDVDLASKKKKMFVVVGVSPPFMHNRSSRHEKGLLLKWLNDQNDPELPAELASDDIVGIVTSPTFCRGLDIVPKQQLNTMILLDNSQTHMSEASKLQAVARVRIAGATVTVVCDLKSHNYNHSEAWHMANAVGNSAHNLAAELAVPDVLWTPRLSGAHVIEDIADSLPIRTCVDAGLSRLLEAMSPRFADSTNTAQLHFEEDWEVLECMWVYLNGRNGPLRSMRKVVNTLNTLGIAAHFKNSSMKRWDVYEHTAEGDPLRELYVCFRGMLECYIRSNLETGRSLSDPSFVDIQPKSSLDVDGGITQAQLHGRDWTDFTENLYSVEQVNTSIAHADPADPCAGINALAALVWQHKLVNVPSRDEALLTVLRVSTAMLALIAHSLEHPHIMDEGGSPIVDMFRKVGGVGEEAILMAYMSVHFIISDIVDYYGDRRYDDDTSMFGLFNPNNVMTWSEECEDWEIPTIWPGTDDKPVGGFFRDSDASPPQMTHLINLITTNAFGPHLRTNATNDKIRHEMLQIDPTATSLKHRFLMSLGLCLKSHVFSLRPLKRKDARLHHRHDDDPRYWECGGTRRDTHKKKNTLNSHKTEAVLTAGLSLVVSVHGTHMSNGYTEVSLTSPDGVRDAELDNVLPIELIQQHGLTISPLCLLHGDALEYAKFDTQVTVGDTLMYTGVAGSVDVDMAEIDSRTDWCETIAYGRFAAVTVQVFLDDGSRKPGVDDLIIASDTSIDVWQQHDLLEVVSISRHYITLRSETLGDRLLLNFRGKENAPTLKCFSGISKDDREAGCHGIHPLFAPRDFAGALSHRSHRPSGDNRSIDDGGDDDDTSVITPDDDDDDDDNGGDDDDDDDFSFMGTVRAVHPERAEEGNSEDSKGQLVDVQVISSESSDDDDVAGLASQMSHASLQTPGRRRKLSAQSTPEKDSTPIKTPNPQRPRLLDDDEEAEQELADQHLLEIIADAYRTLTPKHSTKSPFHIDTRLCRKVRQFLAGEPELEDPTFRFRILVLVRQFLSDYSDSSADDSNSDQPDVGSSQSQGVRRELFDCDVDGGSNTHSSFLDNEAACDDASDDEDEEADDNEDIDK